MATQKWNNMPVYHLLAIVEFTFLFLLFRQFLGHGLPWIVLAVVAGFDVIDSILIESIWTFNSTGWSVNILILMVIGLMFLYHLYTRSDNYSQMLTNQSIFVIHSGLMIYFGGSLFTYLLGWYILSHEAVGFFHNGWLIQCIANILKNIIVAYGIWLGRPR